MNRKEDGARKRPLKNKPKQLSLLTVRQLNRLRHQAQLPAVAALAICCSTMR